MFKTILFPVDIHSKSNAWETSLPVVKEYAKVFKSKVILLTVLPEYAMNFASDFFDSGMIEKITKDTEKKMQAFIKDHMDGIKTEAHVKQGTIYECIIDKSKKADVDLIIMSASRPELKDYLLGPNAARVVRHSDCSVLVVRD